MDLTLAAVDVGDVVQYTMTEHNVEGAHFEREIEHARLPEVVELQSPQR